MKTDRKTTLDECAFAGTLTEEARKMLETLPATWSGLYVRAIREAIGGKPLLLRRIRAATAVEAPFPPEIDVSETRVPGPAGAMRLRVYAPKKRAAKSAAVFYVHGGGWCLGGVENSSAFCAKTAAALGVPVLAPDYRFAPEAPFPAANDDVLAAARRVFAQADALGLDAGKIFFAGDSAGAQLALCTALALLDAREKLPAGLILFYPVATLEDFAAEESGSRREFDRGGMLSAGLFAAMKDTYLPAGTPRLGRALSPLETSLAGLPPALVLTAECDLLRDDGERLAEKLRADGVPVRARRISGVPHAFLTAPGFPLATSAVLAEAASFLASA